MTFGRTTALALAAVGMAGCVHSHVAPPAPLATCRGPYPTGQDVQLSPGQAGSAVEVRVGDVVSVGDPDSAHRPTASGDALLCLFGGGEADGPPGTPPRGWISYAVVRPGSEDLHVTPRAAPSFTVTVHATR